MSTLKYWVWLSSLSGIGAKTAMRLIEAFDSPEKVFFAREEEYRRVQGITESEIKTLSSKNLVNAKRIMSDCEENNFRIITYNDTDYPVRLKNIFDPPILLYIKGRLPVVDDEAAVAIVGTRSCTPYGIKAAEKIGYEISKAGGIVVTGLARGIDSAAARGALRAGGKVIGVVGTGLDIVYPAENRFLFQDVASTGAIISEYAPGEGALRFHFPARNRIISGVSVGVTIIEAPERSGSLITAARALEQGRDVFAVPGNVDSPACRGSNALLREGAILATNGWDIIEEYKALFPEKLGRAPALNCVELDPAETRKLVARELGLDKKRHTAAKEEIDNAACVEYIDLSKLKTELHDDEFTVISSLTDGEKQIDDIIIKCELPASQVLSVLTMLQIKGYVRQKEGKRFSIVNQQ